MQNGENDDLICLDAINLLDEECGLGISTGEETYDSAEVINNSQEGALPTVGMCKTRGKVLGQVVECTLVCVRRLGFESYVCLVCVIFDLLVS